MRISNCKRKPGVNHRKKYAYHNTIEPQQTLDANFLTCTDYTEDGATQDFLTECGSILGDSVMNGHTGLNSGQLGQLDSAMNGQIGLTSGMLAQLPAISQSTI